MSEKEFTIERTGDAGQIRIKNEEDRFKILK